MTPLWDHLSVTAGWIARSSLEACLLIGLILALQAALGRWLAPRWRHALWLILIVKLALPIAPASSLSLYNLLAMVPHPWAPQPYAPLASATPTQDAQVPADPVAMAAEPTPAIGPASSEQPAIPAASAESIAAPPHPRAIPWASMLATGWLAGVILMAITILLQSLRLAGISRQRLLTDQYVLDLLEDCKQQMGVSNYLAVVETPRVTSPALFGFVRPRLLLPHGVTTSLGPQQLRHVFLHELAHLRRHDVLVSWIVALLQALHWFNPLVWYAFSRMRAERELACDALALSQPASPEPKEYGRTIVQLLESHFRPRYQPSLAGVLEDKSQLIRRITMIAQFRKSPQVWSAPAAALLVLVGAVTLTNAQTSQPAAASPSTAELVTAARQVVADMAKGDFARVTDRFDNTMKAALPAKQLQTAWDGVVQQAGPFQEMTAVRTEQFGAHKIILVTCRFQHGPVDTKVVFDATGQIAGLFLQPTQIAANGSASSQPSTISFTDQDLKVEPYKEGGLFQAVASVHSTGTEPSGPWEVHFYRGEPKKGKEAGPGGAGGVGPIEPGKTFHEASLPFALQDGTHTIIAVLTPAGTLETAAGLRAAVTVTVQGGKIVHLQPGLAPQSQSAGPAGDISISGENLRVEPYPEGGWFRWILTIPNNTDRRITACPARFYRGALTKDAEFERGTVYKVGPIEPGGRSCSMSAPFPLREGTSEIHVVLGPTDTPPESIPPHHRAGLLVTVKDGKIVSQTPHATQTELPDPTANDSLLNEGQRLYAEWTDTHFNEVTSSKQYADLSPQAKAELEPKWLAALNTIGPKKSADPHMICNLGAVRSRKAVPALLRIAAERREKDNADRCMAVRSLSLIGDPSVVPHLIPLTYHYNQNTRFWAQISLVRLTGQNFGDDWQKWTTWWNSQGKQPQVSMTPISWPCSNPEWMDPARQKEADAQWIENAKRSRS